MVAVSHPDGKSWNSKNVMPFWAREDIPYDRTVYLIVRTRTKSRRYANFAKDFKPEEWTPLKEFPRCCVYVRKAKYYSGH